MASFPQNAGKLYNDILMVGDGFLLNKRLHGFEGIEGWLGGTSNYGRREVMGGVFVNGMLGGDGWNNLLGLSSFDGSDTGPFFAQDVIVRFVIKAEVNFCRS